MTTQRHVATEVQKVFVSLLLGWWSLSPGFHNHVVSQVNRPLRISYFAIVSVYNAVLHIASFVIIMNQNGVEDGK